MNTENINIKDIKVGETYNVRVKVFSVENGNRIITRTVGEKNKELSLCATNFFKEELPAFSPVSPAPKYDPCRLFRKGDKVRVVTYKGRNKTGVQTGEIGSIDKDEKDADVAVEVIFYGDDLWEADPAYLELVTPVEELEPYSLDECGFANAVYLRKNGKTYLTIPYGAAACFLQSRAEALAAAEAECARLNAEYRKENNHE